MNLITIRQPMAAAVCVTMRLIHFETEFRHASGEAGTDRNGRPNYACEHMRNCVNGG